ncbi:unnamed protein product [Schistosoma guineensis]|nr:unnamed protein product [Schistosoma guineensis]
MLVSLIKVVGRLFWSASPNTAVVVTRILIASSDFFHIFLPRRIITMLANERLRFKLHSVNYPVYDVFDVSDLASVRNVIVWLEDRLIRALPAESRLRDVQSLEWTSYLNKYLQAVKCPFNESNSWAMLDWLLSKALLLEYNSSRNTQHSSISENPTISTNAFNNIDANSDEFKENVLKMAKLLQIPAHPDIKILFKAVCLVIEQKLEVNILNDAITNYGTSKVRLSANFIAITYNNPMRRYMFIYLTVYSL